LAHGQTVIENFSASQDCHSTLDCLSALGVPIQQVGDHVVVEGVGLDGLKEPTDVLNAENSGTTIRLLSGILAAQPFTTTITGDASLQRRPMRRIIEPLTRMGAAIDAREGNYPPLKVRGATLRPIEYHLPVPSAQVKSCILLAGLHADGSTTVQEPVNTRNHTEIALRAFQADVQAQGNRITVRGRVPLQGSRACVPGDISSAAFFVSAALMIPQSELVIKNVGLNPTRTGFVRLLQALGAEILITDLDEVQGEPVGNLLVRHRPALFAASSMQINGSLVADVIDEIPILAVLGTQLAGGMILRDARELRVKESDRIHVVAENLRRMGAAIEELDDGLIVTGRQPLHGAEIESYGDHRIAMAFAIADLIAEGEVRIKNADCVAVSFPSFFQALRKLEG
jgi:3-phosphoshikimate 1-carboxyvinyltransferase